MADEYGLTIIRETSPVSLDLAPDIDFERYSRIVGTLRIAEIGLPWWIGDALVFAKKRGLDYENRAVQLFMDLGFKPRTMSGYAAVASFIPKLRRRADVDFSHHKVVAYLKDEKQADALLAQAAADEWTVRELEAAVRALGAQDGKGPVPAIDSPRRDAPVTEAEFLERIDPQATRVLEAMNGFSIDLDEPSLDKITTLRRGCDALMAMLMDLMGVLKRYDLEPF
jgi:hypothetical protein